MIIDEKKVFEVIGRLRGRANSHKNAAIQTNDPKKADAHMLAYSDMMSLSDDLADSTDNPEYAKSITAYNYAVNS
jgi:hypothetical protein